MYKVTILGDIMFKNEMQNYDYKRMFSNVTEYFKKSNLIIANLETPIANNISKNNIKKYQFVAPKSYVKTLKEIGIDMISTANNHCLDNGKKGIFETIDILDSLGIEHIGTYKNKGEKRYIIKNIEDKKIIFLANTYGTNAFQNNIYLNKKDKFHVCMIQAQELNNKLIRIINNSNNFFIKILRKILKIFHIMQFQKPIYERKEKKYLYKILKDIKKIKKEEGPDYIIMMMHDGGQNNDKPISRTIKHVNYMRKLGINAIITNHEHMIHKIELQKNGIITYSLGNFIGINGILEEPYDKMQEYSIGVNIYFLEKKIKYTFTIFKVIYDENQKCITVNNLFDLINTEKDIVKKQKLIDDNKKIVNNVLSNNCEVNVKLEYDIGE